MLYATTDVVAEKKSFEAPRHFEPNGFADAGQAIQCIGINWEKGSICEKIGSRP
jgi:hypothetical protein